MTETNRTAAILMATADLAAAYEARALLPYHRADRSPAAMTARWSAIDRMTAARGRLYAVAGEPLADRIVEGVRARRDARYGAAG